MNFLKVYNAIINRASQGTRTGYLELHHKIPRCVFGEGLFGEKVSKEVDSDENLVYLTAREHFVAHWLLHRAFPKNKKLGLAFWAMAGMISPDQNRDYVPSSRAIAEARLAASNAKKIPILQYDLEGDFITEFKSLNDASNYLGVLPNAIGQNLSGIAKSSGGFQWRIKTKVFLKKIEPYFIENNGLPIGKFDLDGNLIEMFESLLDAERKTGHKEGTIRASMNRGSKVKRTDYFFIQYNRFQIIPKKVMPFEIPIHGISIPIVQLSFDGKAFINEFQSIRRAEEHFDIKKSHISCVCKGSRKSALGYLWKYKYDYNEDLPKVSIHAVPRKNLNRPVAQYDLDGKFIQSFATIADASKHVGIAQNSIVTVAQGKHKYTSNFQWAYISNDNIPILKPIQKANNVSRKILKIDLISGDIIKTLDSVIAAANSVSGSRSNIIACLSGRRKTAYGFKWIYG